MQSYPESIGAGETKIFPSGKRFLLRNCASVVSIIVIGKNGQRLDTLSGIKSIEYHAPEGFRHLEITSAAAQNLDILIGHSDDARILAIDGTIAVNIVAATGLNSITSTVVNSNGSTIIAAKANRKRITIHAMIDNVFEIYVGATDSWAGIRLQPGEKHTMYSTALIRIRALSGTPDCYYSYLEEVI